MNLAEECYRLAAGLPKEETYGIATQVRRAGVSIPANIAEGYGRENTGSYIQFLRVAQGSLKELETHLLLSGRVQLTSRGQTDSLLEKCEVVGKLLRSLIRALQAKKAE